MTKRNKTFMTKIRHNCPSCQSTYTLLETHLTKHLTKKDISNCQTNCPKVWEKIIHKYCQEKVLGQELEENKDHGSN